MNLQPTCRYGHGDLEEIVPGDNRFWGLMGASLQQASMGNFSMGQPLATLETNGSIYTIRPFRCPKCGYLELFDDRGA